MSVTREFPVLASPSLDPVATAIVGVPTHPITLDEFWELDIVDENGWPLCAELVDGVVVVSPAPGGPHQSGVMELAVMLAKACPPGLRVLPGIGWVTAARAHHTVRIPDVVVVTEQQVRDVRLDAPPVLAVEVVSRRSSLERDLVTKRREYAEAGCRNYWVLLPDRPELIRYRLDESGATYVEVGRTVGRRRVRVTDPYPVTIDLRRLIV